MMPKSNIPPEITLEDQDCPMGCARDDEPLFAARDQLHGLPGEFSVVRCRQCGLMRTNPRPTAATIGYYYPDDYQPYLQTQITDRVSFFERLKQRVRPILDSRAQSVPRLTPGVMLEVGCASGGFLHHMQRQGWRVFGIEFSESAAKQARQLGFDVTAGQIETVAAPAEPADLITAWMVLEHTHEPLHTLQRLWQWTKPGGWLALSVPNAGALEFAVFKDHWYALHIPNHLYHFTPRTIRAILHAAGWQHVQIFHQRTLMNALMSGVYVLQEVLGVPPLAHRLQQSLSALNALLFPLSWLLALCGQTGRMTVWAQKTQA